MRTVKTRLFILLCIFAVGAQAKQSYFHKEESPDEITLKYRWTDSFGTARNLSFDLDKQNISRQYKQNKSYRPEIAQRYVYIQLQKEAQKINPREARVSFRPLGREIQINVVSDSENITNKWQNHLNNTQEKAFVEYLGMNYYDRYISPYGQKGVKPDHTRFVAESVKVLLPAAQAIYEQIDEDSTSRTYVNLLLSWVQSIPYDTLEDRMTSNGAGYLAPTDVLISNHGDCDSKTVLTAALLRSLLPKLQMAIVYLPNHALLAANLPHFDTEHVINEGGIEYVLLEPTGPAVMRIGRLGEETERHINSGMYTVDIVP